MFEMKQESDNESSDSSSDFLTSSDKIDLNSSFFKCTNQRNLERCFDENISNENENWDIDLNSLDENNYNFSELYSRILQNIKETNNHFNNTKPSTSLENNSKDLENHDNLSKEIRALLKKGESTPLIDNEYNSNNGNSYDVQNNYCDHNKVVEIPLSDKTITINRKQKKIQDLQKVVQNKINQRIRTSQIVIHKVGLLTWLAHGFYLNKLATDPELSMIALSLVSSQNYPKNKIDLTYLTKFTKWFRNIFQISVTNKENIIFSKELLSQRILNKIIYSYIEMTLIYISTLRGMGIDCRLVLSLQPPPLKPKLNQVIRVARAERKIIFKQKKDFYTKIDKTKKIFNSNAIVKNDILAKRKNNAITVLKKNICTKSLGTYNCESNNSEGNIDNTKFESEIDKLIINKQDTTSSEEFENTDNCWSIKSSIINIKKQLNVKENNQKLASFVNNTIIDRKLFSSDEDNVSLESCNVWIEVYLESENSWTSVDVLDSKINCVTELYKKADHPVLYVIAWNSDGTLKDVTRRYCSHWLTDTRKKQVDAKWWRDTLSNWKEKETPTSKIEDEQLLQREISVPLPKTVNECKGHPLYVLTRHLLKFEAIYPSNAAPLGYLKNGEAIYSRYCVHTLYSRETWFKQARIVKSAEVPYKIVKAMPKYDKFSGLKLKDQSLELFGEWQTSAYDPPVAKNGKVPRNEYGNVDLFKLCMLPKGTSYINLPALNRIARKLNIDCAPACVGFNFGCRGAQPVLEGFVVCEQYADTLRDAWESEQIEIEKRSIEKQKKKVYEKWSKLIKGLLVKKKINAKYCFLNENNANDSDKDLLLMKISKDSTLTSIKMKNKTTDIRNKRSR